jgi:hypothetical protein
MAATSLTFVQLQDRVLNYGYGEVDRTRVKSWINQAYDDVISRRRWSWLEATETVTTVANQQTLTLSGITDPPLYWGRLRPNAVGVREPVYLDPMRYTDGVTRRATGATDKGQPSVYTFFGDTITFWPIPDAAYGYTLYYWKGTTELVNDADVPLVPAQWRHVLVMGALRYAAERDRNDASLMRRTAEYEKNIANMLGSEYMRQAETGLTAEMPNNYYGEFDPGRSFWRV